MRSGMCGNNGFSYSHPYAWHCTPLNYVALYNRVGMVPIRSMCLRIEVLHKHQECALQICGAPCSCDS